MEKRSYTISTVAKYRTRLLRLRGNFVKVLGYCFHFFFPKKRFSLPCVERSSFNTEHSMKIPRKIWQTNFSEKCTLPMYWNFKHNRSMSPEFEYNYVSTEARDDYREYQKFCVRGGFRGDGQKPSFRFFGHRFYGDSVKGNALARSPRRIISAAPSHAMARGCRSGERLT